MIYERLDGLYLSDDIKTRIRQWIKPPFDEDTRNEIISLIEVGDAASLQDRFYTDLEFGTGGLRGIMEAGTNRMNMYTVSRATQGLANYIIENTINGPSKGVVIAHDSRHNSPRFAEAVASVLSGNGIKVYLYKEMRPTPCVSFAVRYLGAQAGVMLTASHNPPQYNGYKVSWDDGCQVTPPHDEGIIDEVLKVEIGRDKHDLSLEEAMNAGLLEYLDDEVDNAYKRMVLGLTLSPEALEHQGDNYKMVYTPLHGVGGTMLPYLLEEKGFRRVYYVQEQMIPDGSFPTVKSPNPEEPAALELALGLAGKNDAELVLATDPDCDRLGIAVRDGEGKFVQLSGNQTLALLVDYVLALLKQHDALPSRPAVVKTIVTTDLISDIADYYGVECFETLTGFKWIYGKQAGFEDWKGEGIAPEFVVGGEESFGYSIGIDVRDKDACIASTMIAELGAYLKDKGLSLYDGLNNLYLRHGYYIERLVSHSFPGLEGQEEMAKLMERFRRTPLSELAGYRAYKASGYIDRYRG